MKITYINGPSRRFLQTDDDPQTIAERIKNDLGSVTAYFSDHFERAQENLRFYKPEQWTEQERAEFRENYRHPYELNECHTKINHLVGTQTQTRLDIVCRGRERGDAPYADLCSTLLKWSDQLSDIEIVETSVFKSSLISGIGAAVVRWEMRDVLYGYPVIEQVPAHELRWDLNAARIDLQDARWMARTMYVMRSDALEMMPDHSETITRTSAYNQDSLYGFRSDKLRYFSHTQRPDIGRDLIRIVEHYERALTYSYIVADDVQGVKWDFDSEHEAQQFYNDLVTIYSDSIQLGRWGNESADDASPLVLMRVERNTYIQTIMIGEEVVSRTVTALPRFPWIINFCYFEAGDFWAFMDYLKDPQRLINRFFAQWDYQLGTATKNLTTVQKSLLPPSYTMADVEDILSRTSPILEVRSHEAIKSHDSQRPQAELFSAINWAIIRMQEAAGGRNHLGLQESAAESGRAVIARSEQAGIARLPLFDNLRIWRRQVAMLTLWHMKNFMTAGQITSIIGHADEVPLMQIDDGVVDTLREMEIDIVVSEATQSDSVRERQFEQLLQFFQQVQTPAEIATPILLEYSGLPETTKHQIQEMLDFYKEYTAAKAAQEKQAKMLGEVQDSIQKSRLKKQLSDTPGSDVPGSDVPGSDVPAQIASQHATLTGQPTG